MFWLMKTYKCYRNGSSSMWKFINLNPHFQSLTRMPSETIGSINNVAVNSSGYSHIWRRSAAVRLLLSCRCDGVRGVRRCCWETPGLPTSTTAGHWKKPKMLHYKDKQKHPIKSLSFVVSVFKLKRPTFWMRASAPYIFNISLLYTIFYLLFSPLLFAFYTVFLYSVIASLVCFWNHLRHENFLPTNLI